MHDVIVLENLCFRPSTCKRKSGILKRCVFVIKFTGNVRTVDQTEEKNLRFQSKSYTCGRRLTLLFVIQKKTLIEWDVELPRTRLLSTEIQ